MSAAAASTVSAASENTWLMAVQSAHLSWRGDTYVPSRGTTCWHEADHTI